MDYQSKMAKISKRLAGSGKTITVSVSKGSKTIRRGFSLDLHVIYEISEHGYSYARNVWGCYKGNLNATYARVCNGLSDA